MAATDGFKRDRWLSVITALRSTVAHPVVPGAVFKKIVGEYIDCDHLQLSPDLVAAASTDYTLTPGSQRSPSDVAAALRNSGCENIRCHLTAEYAPRLNAIAKTGMQLRQLVLIPPDTSPALTPAGDDVLAAATAVIKECGVVELWLTLPSAIPLIPALSAGASTIKFFTTSLPSDTTVAQAQAMAESSPLLESLTLFHENGPGTKASSEVVGALVGGLRSLQSLTLHDVHFDDTVARALSTARSRLTFIRCDMTCGADAAVALFSECTSIRGVEVRGLSIDVCRAIGRHAMLETLFVVGGVFDDAQFEAVLTPGMASRLRFLNVAVWEVTDLPRSFALIGKCHELRDLFLSVGFRAASSGPECTAAAAAEAIVAGCPKLRCLTLFDSAIGDAVARSVYDTRGDGTVWRGPGRTCAALEVLTIYRGRLRGANLGQVGSLRQLAIDCAQHLTVASGGAC